MEGFEGLIEVSVLCPAGPAQLVELSTSQLKLSSKPQPAASSQQPKLAAKRRGDATRRDALITLAISHPPKTKNKSTPVTKLTKH